ncbi:hypothetical protein TNCV_3310861 [Trichonephila clavipes]|nr:hypothetical protein TNCV_3310861 [Trichonephila clavipes]
MGAECWRIFPSPQGHAYIVEVEIGGIAIFSQKVQHVSGSGNFHPFLREGHDDDNNNTDFILSVFSRYPLRMDFREFDFSGDCGGECTR